MHNTMRGDVEPIEQRPVQAITDQMKHLIEIGGEPFDRDIDLVNRHRLQYGVTKVGIDVDPETGVFRCVVTRQAANGEFSHQDWYTVTPANQMHYEEVKIPFEYEERTRLMEYEEALTSWNKLVVRLQKAGKLSDVDEYLTLDGFRSDYMSMRANVYRQSRAAYDETISTEDRMAAEERRREEFRALQLKQRDTWNRHLATVHQAIGDEEFPEYKARFEAVMSSFIFRLRVMDDAEMRLVEASKEVNERFDLGLAGHASPDQAWQLLALLDTCQDYRD